MNIECEFYKAKIKNTGLPMDNHIAIVGLWDYDKSSYHLNGWLIEDNDIFLKSMYEVEKIDDLTFEEYKEMWNNGYESCNPYCFENNQVEILEKCIEMQEKRNEIQ